MKKWLVRLAVISIAIVTGVVGTWWYMGQHSEPSATTNVETKEEAVTPVISENIEKLQRKSPVLGKEIPGLPEFCADKLISVSGCDGQTEITTDQGNTYRLVEIGNQCWFADNAKEIPTTDKGWYGYYDNAEEEPSPGEGMLYTWDAAMNGETKERAQGVCPDGWHIPSDFEILLFKKNWNIKLEDILIFKINTINVTDQKIITSGERDRDGLFKYRGVLLSIMSSSPNSYSANQFDRYIETKNLKKLKDITSMYKPSGVSVRCLKN